eukprot:2478926-Pyramimonas_sp.AAC.1
MQPIHADCRPRRCKMKENLHTDALSTVSANIWFCARPPSLAHGARQGAASETPLERPHRRCKECLRTFEGF